MRALRGALQGKTTQQVRTLWSWTGGAQASGGHGEQGLEGAVPFLTCCGLLVSRACAKAPAPGLMFFAITVLKFMIIFEQEALHFQFVEIETHIQPESVTGPVRSTESHMDPIPIKDGLWGLPCIHCTSCSERKAAPRG